MRQKVPKSRHSFTGLILCKVLVKFLSGIFKMEFRSVKSAAISKTLLLAALVAGLTPQVPAFGQELRLQIGPGEFRFEHGDERANEGKRASCEVYAQISVVQAEANRRYNCGYGGERWDTTARTHFHWCRYVRREAIAHEFRDRAIDLQRCFDRMGDFDEERSEYRRERE